jgi:UDP-N-acetylmuramoyl-L-alanyl-D-glutamate--2,6-diaminopimelate ligase
VAQDRPAVRLADLVDGLQGSTVTGTADREVTRLTYDSRRVEPGDLFFALPGVHHDGRAFARDAIGRGAVAVVSEEAIESRDSTVVRVPDARRAMAAIACRFHGHPSRSLRVVGVTGTNGKTTTTYLLEGIFQRAGWTAGVIGTTGVHVGDERRPSAFTTPESPELQALLRDMVARGVQAVAVEVSSHALAQSRSYGLECDVAVFTNLSHDHLDYHGTLERYLDAKLMLFDGRNGATSKPAAAAVNMDDPAAQGVLDAAARGGLRRLGYGVDPVHDAGGLAVRVTRVEPLPGGLSLEVLVGPREGPGPAKAVAPDRFGFTLPMLGRYNAYNAAAAFAATMALGVPEQTIVRGLETAPAVPGRLERVAPGGAFDVIVDYAHTPDALALALAAVRDHARGRVLLVFGAGGDRDRAKRPRMGAAAERGADLAWITSDNPRGEEPAAIAAEIAAGMSSTFPRVVLDRREAIAEAVREARAGDVVLVAGKGHETTQTIGDRVLPFDDRVVAREILARRPGGAP